LFNDADGSYFGSIKGQSRGLSELLHVFAVGYLPRRASVLTIVQPQRIDDFVGTMLAIIAVQPARLPSGRWRQRKPVHDRQHAIPVIAEATPRDFAATTPRPPIRRCVTA